MCMMRNITDTLASVQPTEHFLIRPTIAVTHYHAHALTTLQHYTTQRLVTVRQSVYTQHYYNSLQSNLFRLSCTVETGCFVDCYNKPLCVSLLQGSHNWLTSINTLLYLITSLTPKQHQWPLCRRYIGPRRRNINSVLNLEASSILYIGQAFRYSPEKAFYIFIKQIYFII